MMYFMITESAHGHSSDNKILKFGILCPKIAVTNFSIFFKTVEIQILVINPKIQNQITLLKVLQSSFMRIGFCNQSFQLNSTQLNSFVSIIFHSLVNRFYKSLRVFANHRSNRDKQRC